MPSVSMNRITLQGVRISSNVSPTPPVGQGGSIYLNGSTYLQLASGADWPIYENDFTVEWFINQSDANNWPRVFAFGPHPTYFGVSIEGGTFYFWSGGNVAASMGTTYNTWNHMAVTRESGMIRLFVNGQMGAEVSYMDNYGLSGIPLTIGVDPGNIESTIITCDLTNFRYVVGTALYTAPFTPPTAPLTAVAGTKLLLLATDSAGLLTDSSVYAHTVNVMQGTPTWSSNNPF